MVKHTVCTLDRCGKKHWARGYCQAHYMRAYRGVGTVEGATRNVSRPTDHADGTRTCAACGTRRPLAYYYKSKNCTLGRRATCKDCTRARDAKRRAEVPNVYYELDRLSGFRRRARLAGTQFDRAVSHDSLRARDGDRCAYCDAVMDFTRGRRGRHARNKATIDHVVPIARGGAHTFENTVLACLSCNFSKNDKPLSDWVRAG